VRNWFSKFALSNATCVLLRRGECEAAGKEAADLRVKLDATNTLWMNAVNAERQGWFCFVVL
jgi:hypothetical protein